jgi:hypothetical protein
MVIVFTVRHKVRVFKADRGRWILREIKIHSAIHLRAEVKPSVQCRKILGMLKIPAENEGDTLSAKFTTISRQVSPASLVRVSAGNCQRALRHES